MKIHSDTIKELFERSGSTMKTQYILTEEEYGEIIRIINIIDADLNAFDGYMDDMTYVEKCIICLNRSLSRLKNNLKM